MKFRPQRGGLAEAMAEVITLPPTRRALAEHLGVREYKVVVKPYGIFDERIGWNTHLVTIGANAVGFTDGPLES